VFQIENSKETLVSLKEKVSNYIRQSAEQGQVIDRSSDGMSSLIGQIETVCAAAEQKRSVIDMLANLSERAKKDMQALFTAFSGLEKLTREIDGIADVIDDVSARTNLLAMNAAIEAAHAGEAGRGFAVVAGEIRSLAVTTSDNANSISSNIKAIVKQIDASMELLNKADEVMSRMITGINNVEASFSEIIQSHSVMTSSTHELTGDLNAMNETSETLRSLETDIISSLETISRLIASLDDAGNKAKSGCGPSLNMFSRSGRASKAGQQASA
jgi:methyl-accepting chemotaxis protein